MMQILSDYFENDALRASFRRLALDTFGLDFEPWYQSGAFHGRYHPFSVEEDGEILANISANEFCLCVEGKIAKAMQLGTVMTRKEHRGRGLARRLMEYALPLLRERSDFIFLFANDTVLGFYPRFGFRRIPEVRYQVPVSPCSARRPGAEPVLFSQNRGELLAAVKRRVPASRAFAPVEDIWPMDVCLADASILRLPEGPFVLWEKEGSVFTVQDIISVKPFDLTDVIPYLDLSGCDTLRFHFLPEGLAYRREEVWEDDDALFVLGPREALPRDFAFPATSHT